MERKEFWLTKGPKKFWLEGKDLLDRFADRIGWTGPRNWWEPAPSGSWTFMKTKPRFGVHRKIETIIIPLVATIMGFLYVSSLYLGETTGIPAINWMLYSSTYVLLLITFLIFWGWELTSKKISPVAIIDWFLYEVPKSLKLIAGSVIGFLLLALLLDALQLEVVVVVAPVSFASIMIVIMSIVGVPPIEEMAFRGFVTPSLAETLGIIPGIAISGIIFGLFHLGMSLLLGAGLTMVLFSMIFGMAMGFIVLWKKNVLITILIHSSFNGLWLLLMALMATL